MKPSAANPCCFSAVHFGKWLLLALLIPSSLMGQTNFTWIGGGGNWDTAANWSPVGIPGPSDSVTISSGTPTLNVSAAISNLVVNTTTGGLAGHDQPLLTVLHSGSWSGGMLSHVRMALGSGCVFTFSGGSKILTSGVLTNQGVIHWVGGSLNLENNQLLVNQPGALLEVAFAGTLVQNEGGTSVFRNEGTYHKSTTPDTNTIQIASFLNTGSVRVSHQGAIRFRTGSSFRSSGPENSFLAEERTQIDLPAGVYEDTRFMGDGPKILVTGNGQAEVTGRIRATNLVYASGLWIGTATLQGMLEWRGGTMSPRLTILPDSTLALAGPDAKNLINSGTITNAGVTRWTGGRFNLENSPTFHNLPGGLFELSFDGVLNQSSAGISVFRNEGTYHKSTTPDTNTIQIASFLNTGSVRVSDQGAIRFRTGSSFRSSGPENSFLAEEGTQIDLPAGVYEDTRFMGDGPKILVTGNGQAEVTGRIRATNLVYASGLWIGTATLQGMLEWRGGTMSPRLTILPDSTLALAGPDAKNLINSGTITNAGVTRWTGGRFNLENSPAFHNLPGGLFELSFDGVLNQSGGGTSVFRNEGIYRKTTTYGTNMIQIASFIQAGSLEVLAGTTRVVGNSSFAPTSSFRTLIGGPSPGLDFGQLQVSGSATLSGTLQLGLLNGFIPSTKQTFPIIVAASRSGTFANFVGGFIAEGFYFQPTYPTTGVRLEVVDGTARFVSPGRINGRFSVQIQGVINGAYQIESSTNLFDWSILATNTIPIGGVSTWVDPAPPTLPRQFYRAVFLP